MPGINAKITRSVSPVYFPWLSKILAQNFLLRPSWSSSYLFFISFSYSHFCRIFPGLKDLVQRTCLLFSYVTLGWKLLRTTDFKQLQIMNNHSLGFQTCIWYVGTRWDLSDEVQKLHMYRFHTGFFQHIQWASSDFAPYFSWLFAQFNVSTHTFLNQPDIYLHFQCCLLEPDHTLTEAILFFSGIISIKSRGNLGWKFWSTLEPLRAKFPRLLWSMNNLNCFISKKCLRVFSLTYLHHSQKWTLQQGGREQCLVQHMCAKLWP